MSSFGVQRGWQETFRVAQNKPSHGRWSAEHAGTGAWHNIPSWSGHWFWRPIWTQGTEEATSNARPSKRQVCKLRCGSTAGLLWFSMEVCAWTWGLGFGWDVPKRHIFIFQSQYHITKPRPMDSGRHWCDVHPSHIDIHFYPISRPLATSLASEQRVVKLPGVMYHIVMEETCYHLSGNQHVRAGSWPTFLAKNGGKIF